MLQVLSFTVILLVKSLLNSFKACMNFFERQVWRTIDLLYKIFAEIVMLDSIFKSVSCSP